MKFPIKTKVKVPHGTGVVIGYEVNAGSGKMEVVTEELDYEPQRYVIRLDEGHSRLWICGDYYAWGRQIEEIS